MPSKPRPLPPRARRGYCYLYVLRCHEFCKVDVSDDIQKRIYDLQLGNPFSLELALYRTFPSSQIRHVEKDMHDMLDQWQHGREWFTAPFDAIKEAVRMATLAILRWQRELETWMRESEERRRARAERKAAREEEGTKRETVGVVLDFAALPPGVNIRQIRKANKIKMMERLERLQNAY
jgi:Meiotically up-regulated gene 113